MKKLIVLTLAILMTAVFMTATLAACNTDGDQTATGPDAQRQPGDGTVDNDNGAPPPSAVLADIPFYIYVNEDYIANEGSYYLSFFFAMPDVPDGYNLDIWIGRLYFQFGYRGEGGGARVLDADTGELLSLHSAGSRAEGTEWSSSEVPCGISAWAFSYETNGWIPSEITRLPAGYELDLSSSSTVRVEYGDERGVAYSKDYDFKESLCSNRDEFQNARWVAEQAYTPEPPPQEGELVQINISYSYEYREGYDPATSGLDWWFEGDKLAGIHSVHLTFAGDSEDYGLNISDAKMHIDGVGHDTDLTQAAMYGEYWLGRYDRESNSTKYGFMLPGAWDETEKPGPGKIWFEFTCNGAELRTYSFDVSSDGTWSVIYDGIALAAAAPTPPILANAIGTVDPNERGNTNGNIANGGRVVAKGDWVYFIERSNLYKVRADGTESELILGGVSGGLNVVGDWIYFATYDALYRMRTDGTGITRVLSEQLGSVNIVGDWIYYSIAYSDSSLYKIRIDGTGGEKLGGGDNDSLSYINVAGDWVYFLVYSSGGWEVNVSLWRVRSDGTDRQQLEHPYSIECLVVADDFIYYSDVTGCLYRLNADTMMETKLIDADCGKFNISGDWIYYQDEYYDLCKIKMDGTGYETLSSHFVYDISVANDWILFNTDYGLVGIRSDGTDLRIGDWLES